MSRNVELIFKVVDQASAELKGIRKQLESLQNLQSQYTQTGQQTQQVGNEAQKQNKGWAAGLANVAKIVGGIGAAYLGVRQAIGDVASIAQKAYGPLIAANEQLNQQIVAAASNIAATQKIIKDGVAIEDPTKAITELQPKLKEVLKQVQIDSINLVGVTSQQLTGVFQILTSNVASLSRQSSEFADPLEAAGKLTIDFAAALGTLGVPLEMAGQEINSILKGLVDQNSVVARQLGITNQQVAQWKAQGVLVDRLRERLEAFTAGNALNAKSISGITSNLKDVFEVVARVAGEPLLKPIVDALKQIETFALNNREAFTRFFTGITTQIASVFQEVSAQASRYIAGILPTLQRLAESVRAVIPEVVDLGRKFGESLTPSLEALLPMIDAVVQLAEDLLPILLSMSTVIQQTTAPVIKFLPYVINMISLIAGGLSGVIDIVQNLIDKTNVLGDAPGIKQVLNLLVKASAFTPSGPLLQFLGMLNKPMSGANSFSSAIASVVENLELVDSSNVEIANKDLLELGTTSEQLSKRIEEGLAKLESPIDSAELEATTKSLLSTVEQARSVGAISVEQAQEILGRIANDTRVSVETQMAAQKQLTEIIIGEGQKRAEAIALEIKAIEGQVLKGELTRSQAEQQITAKTLEQIDARIEATEKALEIAQGSEKRKLTQQLQELNLEREKAAIEGANKLREIQEREFAQAQDKALDAVRLSETQRLNELERLRLQEPELAARIDAQVANVRKDGIQQQLQAEADKLAFLESQGELVGEAEIERQDKIRESQQRTAELTGQLISAEVQAQRALTAVIQFEIDKRAQAIATSLERQTLEYQRQLELIRLAGQAEGQRLELLNAQKNLISSRAALEQTVFQIAIAATEDEKKKARLQEKAGQAKLAAKVRELEVDAQIFEIQQIQRKIELESEKIQARIAQIKSRAALAEAQATAAKTLADPTATKEQKAAALLGVQAAQIGVVGADASAALTDFKAETNDTLSGLQREAFQNQQANELLSAQFEAANSIADPGRKNRALDTLSRNAQQQFGVNANPYVTVIGGGPMSKGQASPALEGITAGFDQIFGGISESLNGALESFKVSFEGINLDPNALGATQSTSIAQNTISIGQVNFTNRIERDSDRAQLDGVRQAIANDLSKLFEQAAPA